jgi:homocysteine S-methyltransferase
MKAGAKGVGGCCTTKAEHVSDIKKAKEIYLSDQVKKIKI